MSFWGCQLKPGQSHKAVLPKDDFLHLSQICLHEPKAGKNYVQVKLGDRTLNLACLETDKLEHQAVDLIFGPEAPVFSNKGSSVIHLTGYIEPNDEAGASDQHAEAAAVVPMASAAKASPKAVPAASPKAAAVASPKLAALAAAAAAAKAEEESDDDVPEEGEEEDLSEGDEDEGESEESEEKEVDEEEAAPPAKKQKLAPGKAR